MNNTFIFSISLKENLKESPTCSYLDSLYFYLCGGAEPAAGTTCSIHSCCFCCFYYYSHSAFVIRFLMLEALKMKLKCRRVECNERMRVRIPFFSEPGSWFLAYWFPLFISAFFFFLCFVFKYF